MVLITGKRTAIAVPSEMPKAPGGNPRLVIIKGPDLGRQIDLDDQALEIGRGEEAGLQLDVDLVSRRHACVQRFGNKYLIADLGSTNGTFVNNEKITTHELVEADQIRVGKVVLKYMESEIEAKYHEQIFNMASVDALTGCFNKRYFDDVFGKEINRAGQTNTDLCLVVFDIDHFKKINDTYGHPAGDAVLKTLCDVVKGLVRETDVFCRVGGEEFTILLPNTNLKTAQGAAELVRGAIEMTDFTFEDNTIPVTVSLGVAEYASPSEGASELYKRTDSNLYTAKRSGRNQVC